MDLNFEKLYSDYMERQKMLIETNPFSDFALHPGKYYEHPFCIFGNLWYIGNKIVCSHLIDTGEGLLVFDSGSFEQVSLLINAIWEAGFNPANVKWMVHAHAHVDHIGGASLFSEMFGTMQYLGAPDAKVMRGHPGKTFLYDSHYDFFQPYHVDVEIDDGDILTFGNTTVRFVMVPGHTEGCLCSFFDVTDGIETKRVGYFGGYGFVTLDKNYLAYCGDTELKMRQTFMDSLKKVWNEPVDILIGNHPKDNNTIEKHAYMMEHPNENPFIDKNAFQKKMDTVMEDLLNFIENSK